MADNRIARTPTYDELKEAINETQGHVPMIAIKFALSHVTIYKILKNYPDLQALREELQLNVVRHKQPLENVEYAIEVCSGNIVQVAKLLNVSHEYIYGMFREYPHLVEMRDSAVDKILDVAINTLETRVNNGDWDATKYLLSTKGKKRGFGNSASVSAKSQYEDNKLEVVITYDD